MHFLHGLYQNELLLNILSIINSTSNDILMPITILNILLSFLYSINDPIGKTTNIKTFRIKKNTSTELLSHILFFSSYLNKFITIKII